MFVYVLNTMKRNVLYAENKTSYQFIIMTEIIKMTSLKI
jgi:hypothetical protein